MLHFLTYATHAQGTFDQLVNNKQGINVKVLGWGEKWTGFSDKFKGVLNYAQKINPDDVIVFMDGFDSLLMRDTKEFENRFYKMNCGFLVSSEVTAHGKVLNIFGTCKNGIMANSGLYMGYARNVIEVLGDAMKRKCSDDQVNLNAVCKNYEYLKVDEKNEIFQNINYHINKYNGSACVIQRPGTVSFDRYIRRGIKEYSQFSIEKILILSLTLLTLFPGVRKHIGIVSVSFAVYFILFCDKSCIQS